MSTRSSAARDDISPPPRLRPTWTTWMWLAFAVAVLILTVFGLIHAGAPVTR